MESAATGATRAATGASTTGEATFGIHLLGQPRFTLFGQPHRFSAPPRTLPLLAYLLLNREAYLTRERIALALWPDDSEEEARTNLRRHLHHLKAALPPLDGSWFVAEAETLRWQPNSQASFDVDIFERCIAAGELERAAGLYAGELLPSVYDDWIGPHRERMRALFVSALETLLLRARSARQFPLALDYARRILSDDPWREDTLRALMSIRYESGDRTGALSEYERFAARLTKELGVEPMAETRAVYEAARDDTLSTAAIALIEPPRATAATTAAFPFLGRDADLQFLRAA
jgi:DNA-binding SARP family transcriptional activator